MKIKVHEKNASVDKRDKQKKKKKFVGKDLADAFDYIEKLEKRIESLEKKSK